MTRVITIAREHGSGATAISRILADRTGWRILDHDIISEVLDAAQFPPAGSAPWQSDLWFRKLVQQVAWNGGAQRLANGDLFSVRAEVIEEAARMGSCVIIGRGAQCILRGYQDVFHVFLYAPLTVRLERSVPSSDDHNEAEAAFEQHDRAQAAFLREHFDEDWRDPNLYNLMLDTRHGYRAAAEAIYAAAGFRTASAAY